MSSKNQRLRSGEPSDTLIDVLARSEEFIAYMIVVEGSMQLLKEMTSVVSLLKDVTYQISRIDNVEFRYLIDEHEFDVGESIHKAMVFAL